MFMLLTSKFSHLLAVLYGIQAQWVTSNEVYLHGPY